MRILLLTLLVAGTIYYFRQSDSVDAPKSISSVRSKMKKNFKNDIREPASPKKIVPVPQEVNIVQIDTEDEVKTLVSSAHEPTDVPVQEFQWSQIEEGWNRELKEMLLRLEPVDGEEMHKTYLQEQEAYQAELDGLLNEKQQKSTPEALTEIEQLIVSLDEKHQSRLREVLGAHYEAVRDGYEAYMDQAGAE
jgi:hypothetical protein